MTTCTITIQLTLDITTIPHKHSTQIFVVTYDTSLTFKDHIHDIKQKCIHRLNTLCTRTKLIHILGNIKKLSHSYTNNTSVWLFTSSPAWAPNLTTTHHNTRFKLYTEQIIHTEQRSTNQHWLQTNYINKPFSLLNTVLTLRNHINMPRLQFLAVASENPDYPCHYLLAHQPTPRSIKTTIRALYIANTGLLSNVLQHSNSPPTVISQT